jgi:isoleucyl-tRNA synthetase
VKGIEEEWMISKYNSALKKVSELFESYRLDETISEIEDLFISLSRDYIKLTRNKSGKESIVLKTIKEIYLEVLKMFSPICPFLSEHLWGKMNQKEKSIHFCSWPKFSEKKIDEKLESDFEDAMKIIEVGLRERDRKQIGLKWPLKKAVAHTNKKLEKELEEIIMRQLNIKDIEIKKSDKEVKVELDIELTPELEAEGFSREIARRVQSERKNRGMEKVDYIELKLLVDSELKELLEPHLEFIKERTGSKSLSVVDKTEDGMINFKVKNRELGITF